MLMKNVMAFLAVAQILCELPKIKCEDKGNQTTILDLHNDEQSILGSDFDS